MCYSVHEPVLLAEVKCSNNVFVDCWHTLPEVYELGEVMSLPSQIAPVFLQLCLQGWLAAKRLSAARLMQGQAGC